MVVLTALSVALLLTVLGLTAAGPAPSTAPAQPARQQPIVDFEIKVGQPPLAPLGFAGLRLNDFARVHAAFGEPCYCYLIAFNPDGKEQLCYPEKETLPPQQSEKLDYPSSVADGFPFNDGTGMQAFVLLVSRRPLPSYAEWKTRIGPAPWQRAEIDGIWRFDGQELEQQRPPVRGLAQQMPGGGPKPLADLCDYFKDRSGMNAIQVVAFPVKP